MKEYLKELFVAAQKMQLKLLWSKNVSISISYTTIDSGDVSFTIYVYRYNNGNLVENALFSVCEWHSVDDNAAQMAEFIDYITPYLT